MKIIELFDESPIENILGALVYRPEELVYFGMLRKDYFDSVYLPKIREFLSLKGLHKIKLRYVQTRRNNLCDALAKLEGEINDDCLIDIIGGDDILLTAVGIVFEKHQNLKLFKINPYNGKIYVTDKNAARDFNKVRFERAPEFNISVRENAVLHGGRVAEIEDKFVYTDEFLSDIKLLWELCAKGPRGYMHKRSAPQTWNRFVTTAAGIERMSRERQLETMKKFKVQKYLEELKRLGLVTYLERGDGTIYNFKYKNEQIRACLLKAGDALEQIVYIILKKYVGNGISDVKVGVTLKWKNKSAKGEYVTENEIDVFVMRNATPIFISCKNGKFTSEELYKLSAVADKFGSKYAKKILMVSDLAHYEDAQTVRHLRSRAEEMNIKIVENIHRLNLDELERAIKKAVFGK